MRLAVNQEDVGSTPTVPADEGSLLCCIVTIMQCVFCERSFENGMKLGGHLTWCSKNPKRIESAAKIAERQKGRTLSEQHRFNITKTVNAKIDQGQWHNSFARCRKQTYKGSIFDGKWEVMLAMWFDEHSIAWIRNQLSFEYELEGKRRKYIPDFYLPDIECYVEVKGWRTEKDIAKWSQFQKSLIVLSGRDLQALGLKITVKKDWK